MKSVYICIIFLALAFLQKIPAQNKIAGEWYLAKQVNYYKDGSADSTGSNDFAFFRKQNKLPDWMYIAPNNRFVLHFRDTTFATTGVFTGAAEVKGEKVMMVFDEPIGNPAGRIAADGVMMLEKEFESTDIPYKKIVKVYHKAEIREDFAAFFKEFGLTGTVMVYDEQNKKVTVYNPDRARQAYLPASTFKIFNSMAGLQAGAVTGTDEVFKWDGKPKSRREIEKDMDMREAFKVSCVWFYQEIARRVGDSRMRKYLWENVYGNASTGGGIDRFWLDGDLRISPEQQIDFLRRMHNYQLSFDKEVVDKVKDIMLLEQTKNYKYYGKTGWAQPGTKDIGWFTGFVEKGNNVYYYVVNVEAPLETTTDFMRARKMIAEKVLKEMKILE